MCLLLGMGIMNAYSQTLIDGNKFFDGDKYKHYV